MACNAKDGDKSSPQLFLEETLIRSIKIGSIFNIFLL